MREGAFTGLTREGTVAAGPVGTVGAAVQFFTLTCSVMVNELCWWLY